MDFLRSSLFLLLFFAFLIVWMVFSLALHVAGGLIHLLLVVAAISLILHFLLRGRSS